MKPGEFDRLVLGRRIRHHRKQAGLTLSALGEMVDRPAPYLSLLENGKKEPKVSLLGRLAEALGVGMGQLLDTEPPSDRDRLEIELIRAQETAPAESLGLPVIKPTTRLDDQTLAHIVGLHEALRERSKLSTAGREEVRRANGELARSLSSADGYIPHLEAAAAGLLESAGHDGSGPFSSRNLLDLVARLGFELVPIDDMPRSARSVVDLESRRLYIAQRDELRTRQARKAVLQTLAGFALEHDLDPDLRTFLRQRMETAYVATAVLVPEGAAMAALGRARSEHDMDVEDVKELFYVSYEMAAWRTANLMTRHFGMGGHLLVSDETGSVVKGYSNDGVPVPRDHHGGMETQRLCRFSGARAAFESSRRFATHHQYTDTPAGTFFCVTHVEAGRDPAHAITLGVPFSEARWFRGRETTNRSHSGCPDPGCCRTDARGGEIHVSARVQDRILGIMAPDPYPDVDMAAITAMVDRHAGDPTVRRGEQP